MQKLVRSTLACAVAIALPVAGYPGSPTATLVHAGRLIDGVSEAPRSQVTIVIENGRFIAVEDGYRPATADVQVIDLRQMTVLPGLIDLHTHLTMEFHKDVYLERFQLEAADIAFKSARNAERTLHAGFTTVRDLGDRDNVSIALRKAIAAGTIVGPRIYTSGKSLASTGGHADPSNGMRRDLATDPGPEHGVVNGPEDARKAVRQRYKDGADLIKITATGGVLSVAKSGHNPQFTAEELDAIVATANDYGMHVAAHAHGAEGMKRAIRAGVRSIEHGTFMDDEVIALMKQHGTYFVPTLMAGEWVADKATIDGFFPDLVRPKAAAIGPLMLGTFRKAHQAGVKIAFGTDTGVSRHGDNAREFVLMVEGGMPPMTAIRSATSIAAELLDAADQIGAVAPGRRADLVAVEGDPLTDIKVLGKVAFVMKDGAVVRVE